MWGLKFKQSYKIPVTNTAASPSEAKTSPISWIHKESRGEKSRGFYCNNQLEYAVQHDVAKNKNPPPLTHHKNK